MWAQEPLFFKVTVGSDIFIFYYRWDFHFTLEKDADASQAAGADFL
jgi:hypothetical protein